MEIGLWAILFLNNNISCMTIDEQLKYCRICENRKMDFATGLVCSLTNGKPTFEGTCPDFKVDQSEANRLVQLERDAREEEESQSAFSPERKAIKMGVWGGVLMIAIAAVWFFAGLAAGYIYFYPPVLFVIGIYAIIKGVVKK